MGFNRLRPADLLLPVSVLLCLCGASNGPDKCGGHYPEVTPPRLTVKYGDPASAICTNSVNDSDIFSWEFSRGRQGGDERTKIWAVDRVTEWDMRPQCYVTFSEQCSTSLVITVYQQPVNVSFTMRSSGQPITALVAGGRYELRCEVLDSAPVQNLTVTFYKGQTALHSQQGGGIAAATTPGPQTVVVAWNATVVAEDDGAEFWCDARLDLGGPEEEGPPAVTSERFTAPVFFSPLITKRSDHSITITRTQGETLELNCSATGNPAPSYSWTRPQRGPANGSAVVTIDHVTSSDQGNYTCVASNTQGRDSITYHIHVNIDLLPIIAGVAAAVLVVVMATGCLVYCLHYKQTRMGRYNLMRRIFPSHRAASDHVATQPNGVGQSSV